MNDKCRKWISIKEKLPKRMMPVKLKWENSEGMGGGVAYGRLKRIKDLKFQAMTRNGCFRNSYVYPPDYWMPIEK